MIMNLQVMRAIAALAVVLFHTIAVASRYGVNTSLDGNYNDWGASGVDIFFVISGFVMVLIQNKTNRSATTFLLNRFQRIVPLYWVLSISVLILWFALPPYIFSDAPDTSLNKLLLFVKSISFTSHWFGMFPALKVGWTLEYEILFYMIFSFGIVFFDEWRSMVFAGLALIVLVATGVIGAIALEFALGMGLARLYISKKLKVSPAIAIFLAIFGVIVIVFKGGWAVHFGWERLLFWGVPAALIVHAAIVIPQINKGVWTFLGDASYSIYLVQVFSIPVSYRILATVGMERYGNATAIMVVMITLLAGVVMHILIERPLAKILNRPLTYKIV